MTDTLRKIDAELVVVVQCKGDYFRRISVRKIFPNLCEIMYFCIGSYNNERYN